MMAPIAATCFENDLVRTGGRFAPSPQPAEKRNRRLLAETLMEEPKEPIFEAEEQKGALFKAILSLQRVRVSAYLSIIDCCARNCLRGRRQKILKKLNRRYHTQLDIRSIIAN